MCDSFWPKTHKMIGTEGGRLHIYIYIHTTNYMHTNTQICLHVYAHTYHSLSLSLSIYIYTQTYGHTGIITQRHRHTAYKRTGIQTQRHKYRQTNNQACMHAYLAVKFKDRIRLHSLTFWLVHRTTAPSSWHIKHAFPPNVGDTDWRNDRRELTVSRFWIDSASVRVQGSRFLP